MGRAWLGKQRFSGRSVGSVEGRVDEMGVPLLLFALGAILAFAVRVTTPVINLQMTGLVLMAISVLGIIMSKRSSTWVRRVIIVPRRRKLSRVEEVDQATYPPYVKENPYASFDQTGTVKPGDTSVERMVAEHMAEDR